MSKCCVAKPLSWPRSQMIGRKCSEGRTADRLWCSRTDEINDTAPGPTGEMIHKRERGH